MCLDRWDTCRTVHKCFVTLYIVHFVRYVFVFLFCVCVFGFFFFFFTLCVCVYVTKTFQNVSCTFCTFCVCVCEKSLCETLFTQMSELHRV